MNRALLLLRFSLALVFIWFGLLKLFNVSPVLDIIAEAYPFIIQNQIFYYLLALLEIAIGVGFLIPRFVTIASWVAVVHLLMATLGVLFTPQAFAATFPMLSVVGEFVVKNIVLIAGAVVVALNENST